MGDFTGFTFGDWHSTNPTTGIVTVLRVSSGDRYEEQLHPEIKDRTAEVSGLNGQYYFGSDFGSKTFDIDIAFDSLTEEQFRQLRRVFGTKEIKRLIFDERPYKYYMAKLESPMELSYVCFDEPKKVRFSELYPNEELPNGIRMIDDGEGNRTIEKIDPWVSLDGTQRIYKGEGKISLICYYPFAKSVTKKLTTTQEESGWAISSGILSENDYVTNQIDEFVNGQINLYNAGDIETPCQIYCPFDNNNKINSLEIVYYANDIDNGLTGIKLSNVTRSNASNDIGILINTQTGLIQGVTNLEPLITSSFLYNKYITGGSFFKLQPNMSYEDGAKLVIEGVNNDIQIFYDYLYY